MPITECPWLALPWGAPWTPTQASEVRELVGDRIRRPRQDTLGPWAAELPFGDRKDREVCWGVAGGGHVCSHMHTCTQGAVAEIGGDTELRHLPWASQRQAARGLCCHHEAAHFLSLPG